MLITCFEWIIDKRRAEWKRYQLVHILLFSILAILTWAKSYRNIHSFVKMNYEFLNKNFQLNWKKIPSYTTIRNIIQWVDSESLEKKFRSYSREIVYRSWNRWKFLAVDGKTLRWSFDNFCDKKAIQILSFFLTESSIILWHENIEDCKTNEIPVMQELVGKFWLTWHIFTLDALHCQKKHSKK